MRKILIAGRIIKNAHNLAGFRLFETCNLSMSVGGDGTNTSN